MPPRRNAARRLQPADTILSAVARADPYAGAVGRFYSYYIARPALARPLGRVLWDSDFAPMYASLEQLRAVRADVTVLDVACGSGLALRWLDAGVHYLGIDTSAAMLARSRRTARRRGFADARFTEGDAESLPFADGVAGVALLYNVLHCVAHPEAVLRETVRCLTPGGRLLGSMLLRGASPRVDRLMDRDRESTIMGPGGTRQDLEAWLTQSLRGFRLDVYGAMAVFQALAPPQS